MSSSLTSTLPATSRCISWSSTSVSVTCWRASASVGGGCRARSTATSRATAAGSAAMPSDAAYCSRMWRSISWLSSERRNCRLCAASPLPAAQSLQLRLSLLSQLIDRHILLQYAASLGIAADPAAVAREVAVERARQPPPTEAEARQQVTDTLVLDQLMQ